jgi:hypothetical protein
MPKKKHKGTTADRKSKLLLTNVIGGVILLSVILFLLNYVYGPPVNK